MNQKSAGSTSIRAFAAIVVEPTSSLERLLGHLGELGPCVRPTRAQNLHLTLKFYGDIEPAGLSELIPRFDELANHTSAFRWNGCGAGAFPTAARPSVIWTGARDEGRLARLANEIESFSEASGFIRERRAFRPHVTVARVRCRPPAPLAGLLEQFACEEFGEQQATQLVLFRSSLERSGSVYEPLHVAPFRDDESLREPPRIPISSTEP